MGFPLMAGRQLNGMFYHKKDRCNILLAWSYSKIEFTFLHATPSLPFDLVVCAVSSLFLKNIIIY